MDKQSTRKEREDRLIILFEEYYDRIARYSYIRIGNRQEAEDIASEVFVKALKSLDSYEERGLPMQAWLFKITHNMVVDFYRRKGDRKTVDLELVDIQADGDLVVETEMKLEMERVQLAMENLTEEQREIVRLRFFGGLSSAEVGALFGKSDGAVREAQSSALKKLRTYLVR